MLSTELKGGLDILMRLRKEFLDAEEKYKQAKAAFEDYSREVLPDIMRQNGVYSVTTEDGLVANMTTKTHVNVTKAKMEKVCQWLSQNGGDFLIKRQYVVPKNVADKLMDDGVDCAELTDVNTNSLKSFLLDKLGQRTGGLPEITVDQIPDGINFFQYDEVEFKK